MTFISASIQKLRNPTISGQENNLHQYINKRTISHSRVKNLAPYANKCPRKNICKTGTLPKTLPKTQLSSIYFIYSNYKEEIFLHEIKNAYE